MIGFFRLELRSSYHACLESSKGRIITLRPRKTVSQEELLVSQMLSAHVLCGSDDDQIESGQQPTILWIPRSFNSLCP